MPPPLVGLPPWLQPPLLMEVSFPLRDPVPIVALVLFIILVAPLILRRLRVPGLVGLILAGVVVGPNGLDLLDRDPTIVLLGTMGLLYLMFLAGLEINLHEFRRHRRKGIAFGALTFALPQGLGTAMAAALLGFGWPAAILMGSVFASHTLLAYPIASRLGLAKTEYSTTAVGATIITDTAALLVLAVVAASARGALDAAFWVRLVLSLAAFVFVVFWGVPRLGRWFFRTVRGAPDAEFVFVLATVFAAAFLAELAGVEAIIGAFLAGLALNRLVPEHGPLMNRIQFVGGSLFIPFFLLSVGMLVDLRVLAAGPGAWVVAAAMLATVLLGKWGAAQAAGLAFRYGADERRMLFGLTIPQAAATLAAVLIGFEVGLFGADVLNGTILMILVTCIVGPTVVERAGRRLAARAEAAPAPAGEPVQRVLVPLANPQTAEALMDLAFFLRDPRAAEPVLPLTVALEGTADDDGVAASERLLSHAIVHAAAADVPVAPLTRIDTTVAGGIVRAARERRASTVVIGWNGQPSAQERIFGGVLDQVLEQTAQLVLVCRVGHPLNTTQRVVLAVPPLAEREAGFGEALRAARRLAAQLGAPLLLVAEEAHGAAVRGRLRGGPEAPMSLETLPAWSGLEAWLAPRVGGGDLLVLMGAREGALAWRPALDRLPRVLSQRFPQANFITLYPPETDLLSVATPPRASAPPPSLDRAVMDLPRPLSLPEVVDRLAGEGVGAAVLPEVVRQVHEVVREGAPEVRPGVLLLHAHPAGLGQPFAALGVSPEGLRLAGGGRPAHVVVLLLTPDGASAAVHLQRLAGLARRLRAPGVAEALQAAPSPEAAREAWEGAGEPQGF